MSEKVKCIDILKGTDEFKVNTFKELERNDYLNKKGFPFITDIITNTSNINNENYSNIEDEICLIMLMIKYKYYSYANVFDIITHKYEKEYIFILEYIYTHLFTMSQIDYKIISIQFIILSLVHIDINFISKSLRTVFSIFPWVNLSKTTLLLLFKQDETLIKKFSALAKLNTIENGNTIKSYACTFLNSLINDFITNLTNINENNTTSSQLWKYSESVLSLFLDLLRNKTLHQYVIALYKEKHLLEIINIQIKTKIQIISPCFIEIVKLFKNYFNLNSFCHNNISILKQSYNDMNTMQNIAYSLFPNELTKILTENSSLLDTRENLNKIISSFNHEQILILLRKLNLLYYNDNYYDNKTNLLKEIFICKYERKYNSFYYILNEPLYPNENIYYNDLLLPSDCASYSNITTILPLPKMKLNYLSIDEYLLTLFMLYEYEYAYGIKNDIYDTIEMMSPVINTQHKVEFNGWSVMAIPIQNNRIVSVKEPLLSEEYPEEVIIEIEYNLKGIQSEISNQWDNLKMKDILFYVYLNHNENDSKDIIRAGEIVAIYDEANNNVINRNENAFGMKRRVMLKIDSIQYKLDLQNELTSFKYDLLIRRDAKLNYFKSMLHDIKSLIKYKFEFPKWIELPLMGIVHDNNNNNCNEIKQSCVDYYDTFISHEHLKMYNKETKQKVWSSLYTKTNKDKRNLQSTEINNHNINKHNNIQFTTNQINTIRKAIITLNDITVINCPPGTGKIEVISQIVNLIYQNFPNERTLIIARSVHILNKILSKLSTLNIKDKHLLLLGKYNTSDNDNNYTSTNNDIDIDFTLNGRIKSMLTKRSELLELVLNFAFKNNITIYNEYTCESAIRMINYYIMNSPELQTKLENECNITAFDLLNELKELQILELLRDNTERKNHLIHKQSKIICITSSYAILNRDYLCKLQMTYNNVIIMESTQLSEIETIIPLTLQSNINTELKRFILLGDSNQLPPLIKMNIYKTYCNLDISLFNRLIRNNHSNICNLTTQFRTRHEITELYKWKYPNLINSQSIINNVNTNNKCFKYVYQFINVDDYEGEGEGINDNNSYYNLAEAEYCIGLYMLMCLLGYPSRSISIITPYNGQKELLCEIYNEKCTWNAMFNGIGKISTVDKYQGQHNDYVIMSLVRSKNVGYLKDIRRIMVGISRACLGLFVLGRYELFKQCSELNEVISKFEDNELKLMVCLDSENENNFEKVDDFKHLFRIVQELIRIYSNNNN